MTEEIITQIQVLAAALERTTIHRGDLVILRFPPFFMEGEFDDFEGFQEEMKALKERTGIEFLVLTGDMEIEVVRSQGMS